MINCTLCVPLTLTNDLGKCYATLIFPKPTATDNCCPLTIATSVSAVDENGVTIPLTDLGNGYLQGLFPVTVTGSNVVTVTADDGRGNSAMHQCAVVVADTEPPALLCVDQTVTFKPILTNVQTCIEADFDEICIRSNNTVWFSSVIKDLSSWCCGNRSFTVRIYDQTIELAVDSTNIVLTVPDAYVTFSNGVVTTTTIFTNGTWVTITKPGLWGNTFASGLAWQAPFNLNNQVGCYYPTYWSCKDAWYACRRHVNTVTWCARFEVSDPCVALQWQWSAAVHKSFTNDCNRLCVKPVDDYWCSAWRNSDPAGTCESYKQHVTCGARSQGRCGYSSWYGCNYYQDYTGVLSPAKRVNLGKGPICLGAVEFDPPMAIDNCDSSQVTVTLDPPPGSVLGPGVYPITATADDGRGNTNQCAFNLTVLSPLQVVFDTPCNDNLNDNTAQPDAGFTDMNCPDDPSTPQYITRFYPGYKVTHEVRLLDCNGQDVTAEMGPYVTVYIDVTERVGTYSSSSLINDVPQNYVCVGSPGGIMVLNYGKFQYNLDTTGYEAGTVDNTRFFRTCVWVDYNSSPGVPVGMEDVILESW